MKRTILVVAILIAIAIGIYYAIPKNSYSAIPAPEAPASNAAAIPATTSITVNIKNLSFDPNTINIKTGTKVTWINNDNVAHTITSDSGDLLKSPIITPGRSFSFTFTDPGSENYHCSIHTMMKGNVTITN